MPARYTVWQQNINPVQYHDCKINNAGQFDVPWCMMHFLEDTQTSLGHLMIATNPSGLSVNGILRCQI